MILECPACHARYLVQIGLFAQGGRQVRCARCKYAWHARLPTSIDVVLPPENFETANNAQAPSVEPGAASDYGSSSDMPPQLPAVIRKREWRRYGRRAAIAAAAVFLILLWPILDRQQIVKVFPDLRPVYQAVGLRIDASESGLVFDSVKSEIHYDGGTMKLVVDGFIRNKASEIKFIPNIRAQALGTDRHIIQSWWVAAPAATVAAGGEVPFHTEINAPMQQTIEDVNLEFLSQDEKADAHP